MKFRTPAIALTVATVAVLTACGGGDSGPTTATAAPATLSGTAAVGFPIVGAVVKVMCASGSTLASQPTSDAGAWQVNLAGQSFPCAAQVTGGTINKVLNTTPYHAIALTAGTMNITPLTDLIVANMALSATPSAWFASLTSAALAPVNSSTVNAALNLVASLLKLAQLGANINPTTSPFTPVAGNVMDDTLTALATASLTHTDLLALASAGSAFAVPTDLATTIVAAYLATTSGVGTSSNVAGTSNNLTTGQAANGTPALAPANCVVKFGANAYTRCAANAVANFSTVSMIDATDGKTCTASYLNGTLTLTKGALTVSTLLNSDIADNLTTFGSGTSETIATLSPFSLGVMTLAGIAASTATVQWSTSGVLKKIEGTTTGNASQQFSCSQP